MYSKNNFLSKQPALGGLELDNVISTYVWCHQFVTNHSNFLLSVHEMMMFISVFFFGLVATLASGNMVTTETTKNWTFYFCSHRMRWTRNFDIRRLGVCSRVWQRHRMSFEICLQRAREISFKLLLSWKKLQRSRASWQQPDKSVLRRGLFLYGNRWRVVIELEVTFIFMPFFLDLVLYVLF